MRWRCSTWFRNKPEAAEPYLKTVAEISSNPEAKYALAEYYLRFNASMTRARLSTPYRQGRQDLCRRSSIRLARIEAFADKKAEAHRILDGVLAREPKNVNALLLRGQLFLAENNTVNALTRTANRRRRQSQFDRRPNRAGPDARASRLRQGSNEGVQ